MTTTAMLNVHLSEPKDTKVFADFDQVFDCTNKTFLAENSPVRSFLLAVTHVFE